MAKSSLPPPAILLLLLLLQIVSSTGDGGGVEAACKHAPDPQFCATLLQPYASQLSDGDGGGGLKPATAAMNATLERVDELREYMVHEAVQEQTTPEELAVLSRCLSNVGDGEGALKVALQTLKETKGTERAELLKMMDAATSQLTTCVDSLKKHARDDVVRKAMSLTQDSIQACSLAKNFLP